MDLSQASVAQVMIPVEDLEQGVKFYRDTLSLPFLFTAPPQMAFFQCGTVRLLVGVLPAGTPAQRGSAIYFQVPDIGEVYRTLTDRGVQFRASPHVVHRTPTVELWLAEFRDPDGNQLALMGQKPVSS
jgi:predicted enzyme related to lactoylglutathione lyase